MRPGLIVWHSSASSAFFTRLYSHIHSIYIYIHWTQSIGKYCRHPFHALLAVFREGLKQTISSKFIQFHHLELLRDESLPLPLLPLRRCARDAYLCPKDYANILPEGVLQSTRQTFSAVWWIKSQRYTIATLITGRPNPQQASFFPCIAWSCCELAIWICTARRASSNRSCFECIISLEATDSGCPFIGEFLCIISFSSLVYTYYTHDTKRCCHMLSHRIVDIFEAFQLFHDILFHVEDFIKPGNYGKILQSFRFTTQKSDSQRACDVLFLPQCEGKGLDEISMEYHP